MIAAQSGEPARFLSVRPAAAPAGNRIAHLAVAAPALLEAAWKFRGVEILPRGRAAARLDPLAPIGSRRRCRPFDSAYDLVRQVCGFLAPSRSWKIASGVTQWTYVRRLQSRLANRSR
jgi:hypothetical protein